MNELIIAQRYARALYLAAIETGELDDVASSMSKTSEMIRTIPELLLDLGRDEVTVEKRKRLVDDLCKSMLLNDLVEKLIEILVERGRVALLPYITLRYRLMSDEAKNHLRIHVTVAEKELLEDACNEAKKVVQGALGGKVFCEGKVDKTIIGGAIIRLGGIVVDNSIERKLKDLGKILWESKDGGKQNGSKAR